MVGNDVFRFFFEAGSGIALAVLMFGVLPFYIARSLYRSIKKRMSTRTNKGMGVVHQHAKKNVQEG